VLDDFENQLKNFVKVFPKDYKKVLQAKKISATVK
jgi:glutamate synthase (NADPH/NADH) large chain